MAPDQSCFRFLPSFRRHSFKHFTVSITKIRTTVVSSTITSRQKYWIQLRSWTADRRCFAPLCRITNSVQYTESSSGSVWRSLWRADSFWMFTLYLDINWKKTTTWVRFQNLFEILINMSNKRPSNLWPHSPGVTQDVVQCLKKALCSDGNNVQHHSHTFASHLLCVVRLVPRDRHHHHGNSVAQSLKETVWAGMGDESPSSRMC